MLILDAELLVNAQPNADAIYVLLLAGVIIVAFIWEATAIRKAICLKGA